MDDQRFDGLTRRLAGTRSRRGALAALAGAAVLAVKGSAPAEAAIRFCRLPQMVCNQDRQCCSRSCENGACGCIKRGGTCYQIGLACCSGRCHRGRCR